ncbi:MAG: DUF2283 domain-containing protein [Planctomycetes bacterium]|nr:DUF2283 domain-containing protein [Planctomycetota bacterium]
MITTFGQAIEIHYDARGAFQSAYLRLGTGEYGCSREVGQGVIIDLARDGKVVGIEVHSLLPGTAEKLDEVLAVARLDSGPAVSQLRAALGGVA